MRKILSILMAVLFVGSMYAADVTDTIAMKGFAGITTNSYQNQTKSGVSAKGVDMVAYAYNGSTGQVRGNKTAVAGASVTADDDSKNWSLYNSAAMPGTIKSIKVTQAATGTPKFQNKLYVSLGTATQGDVTAITSAQAQDDGATANEINFTIDASKKYTYFKLLSTEKFTSGSVSDVKVMVTYEKAESSTKTYYLTMTSDWASYTEKFAIYYFKSADNTQNGWSEMMTAVPEEDNTYVGTIPEGYDKLIFVRFKAEATSPRWDEYEEEWYVWSQTVDLTAPTDDKDLFTITTAGTGKDGDGTWSKHGEIVTPAKFYITGDSALVTDAGAPGASWNPAAIKSETDTFTLKNLKAGQEYILKLTLNGTWEGENNIKGYNELTEKTPGLKDISNDHNIGFKLNEAGDVQVIYKDGETPVFKLVGNFVVEIPAKFYITGDSALVTDAGAPGKAWNPDAIKSETDTFTLKNLKAGQEYILKLTLNGTWEGENNIKGYNELTEKTPGLKDISNDHNIGFKLNEAGDVQVIYKDGETPVFKLVGNFVVEIPHYFIAGTMTNWKDEMVELLPLEEKTDSLGVALNLKADSLYLYKIVRVQGTDTAWYGLDGDATMEYGNSTGWYIYKSEGEKNQKNVGLQTTKEAVYPFVLKVKEDHLEVSVTIPARYYAKYAPNWEWAQLIEKEGKWLTDTIVYAGIGVNINVKASDEGNMFFSNTVEEEGVLPIAGDEIAELDTVQFSFNPVDTTLTVSLISKYVAPAIHYYVAGTMTNWKDEMVELLPLEEKTDSLGVALNLKADSLYLYKIVRVQGTDTAWYGLDGDATMEYGNSTGWYIYKSEGEKNQKNVGLQTTKEGDYPVTLVIKEDQLIVSVVIPKPDTKFYAKYADKAGEWNWKLLTEKEGKWLTDTIVYYGGGMNIHSAAEGDGKYFAEIAGVAAKDTAYFSFNPEDSTMVATVVGKYIKPFPVMQIAGQWDMEGENWIVNNMVLAADSLTATYEVSLEKGDYEFKLIKDGKWITKANGGEPYGLHRTWPGVAGVVDEATENLKVTADVAGKYLFTWTFANDSIGITFPDKPEPKLADGYYLVGKFSGVDAWSVEDLSAAKLFAVNPENDKEYQLNITLAVEDSLKVVYVADDVITTWFPAEGDNYGVDANHAGATTIYFRPDYQGGEDWFAGCLYVVPTSTVDINITNDGVQAIKVLRNGQILIIKGEKTYNAQGILVE